MVLSNETPVDVSQIFHPSCSINNIIGKTTESVRPHSKVAELEASPRTAGLWGLRR
jgi:hypothetical protein